MSWWARVTRVGAVLAAGLLTAACSSDGAGGGDGGGGSSREQAEEAAATLAAVADLDELRWALWDEGYASSIRMTGLDGALAESLTVEDARRATDVAAEEVGSSPAGLPDDLAALRADVDERLATGTASPADVPAAKDTMAAYQDVVERVGGEVEARTLDAVDDPRLREGVQLLFGTDRMERRTDELEWLMISSAVGGGPGDPAAIQQLAAAWSDLESTVEEVRAAGASPYREVVDAQLPTGAYEAFAALVEGALDGGPVDIPAVMDAGDQVGQGYVDLKTALTEAARA